MRIIGDPTGSEREETGEIAATEKASDAPGSWNFSLAGVQLEFSPRRGAGGLTVPISGRGGDWIVKLPNGVRIHMEDFSQLLGLYPEEKDWRYNDETVARLIASLAGEAGLAAFVGQLVFVIIAGNGDAHLKNRSLLYRDGIQAELSPAYDLVATIPYQPDDRLALNLAKSKRWEDVSRESFLRLAR